MGEQRQRVNPALVIAPLVVIIALLGVLTVLLVRSFQTSSKHARKTSRELSRRAPRPRTATTIAVLPEAARAGCRRADDALVWIELRSGKSVTVEPATARVMPARTRPDWCAGALRVTNDGRVLLPNATSVREIARPSFLPGNNSTIDEKARAKTGAQ